MKKMISALLTGIMLLSFAPVSAAEEAIINNDFESGELGFGVRGTASVQISTEIAHSGTSSMLVSDRGSNGWEGVNTSVINDIKLDETYYGQMYVKAAVEGESFTVKMSIDYEDETGAQYPQLGEAKVNSSDWTLIEGIWKAEYQGNLKSINVDLETTEDGVGKSFYVDDIFFAHESVHKPAVIQIPVEDVNKNVSYSGIKIPEDVAETDYVSDVERLMALGVVEGYPDGSFLPENKVTRAEFLTMLLRLVNMDAVTTGSQYIGKYTDVPEEHFASKIIEFSTGMGICDGYGEGLFGPEDNVTYAQAVKMLMSIMGYTTVAEVLGGYPDGYMKAARDEKVYVNGLESMDTELTRAKTAELMCSALNVNLYLLDGKGKLARDNNATILSEYYDGDELKGYVISSEDITSGGITAGYGTVNIGGYEFNMGKTRADELVGYYVDFIYGDVDGEDTLLYIKPRSSKNSEMEINARDIDSYSGYQYKYTDGKNSNKTAKLDRNFTLVYNGKTVGSEFDNSLMLPELGSVKLIGQDSADYNMVYITSYETLIVSSVNRNTSDVYDIDNKKVNLDEDNESITFIKPDGSQGSLNDVRKDDILHIMRTADNDKITVRIVRSLYEGIVDASDEEGIMLEGTRYEFSNVYLNRSYTPPKVGTTIKAYLDINEEIAYIDEGSDTSMKVGYFLNAAVTDNGEDITLRYLTSDGTVKSETLRSSLTVDGQSYKAKVDGAILGVLRGNESDSGQPERRIFRYSQDSSGKISKIDFARAQKACITDAEKNEGEQSLYTVNDKYAANNGKESSEEDASSVKYKYKHNARTFIDESGSYASVALSPSTTVFMIPEEGSGKESDYGEYKIGSVSNLGYDDEYKVYAYKMNTDGLLADYAVLFVNNSGSENIKSQDGYVVTRVFTTVNRDNEVVHGVGIYINGEEREYAVKDSEVWEDAVEQNNNKEIVRGDIVRFDTDLTGEISNLTVDAGKGKYGDYFYSAQGYIYLKDDGYAYFTTKRPSASSSFDDMVLIPINDFSITVYNRSTKKAYAGVADEIIDYTTDPDNYSSVYITMNYENAKSLICVVDE